MALPSSGFRYFQTFRFKTVLLLLFILPHQLFSPFLCFFPHFTKFIHTEVESIQNRKNNR
jgi:hypothetical protein